MKAFRRVGRRKRRREIEPAWPTMIYAADATEAHRVAKTRAPHREVQVERIPYFGLDAYRRERH